MQLSFRIKNRFFAAFRELFVHHHGSLEFRAKVFALLIATNNNPLDSSYDIVKSIALTIYKEDEERADFLMYTTKEKVNQVNQNNTLDLDTLVHNIIQDLKFTPRYAKKINIEELRELLVLTQDIDTLSYQENILEFLETLKNETLANKKEVSKDESI